MTGALFGPLFAPAALREAVAGEAWLRAMLDAEAALAAAEARTGVIPGEAALAIAGACAGAEFDLAAIGAAAPEAGNPVVPLVRALRAAVPEDARVHVHHGATSQDILDTAAMLVAGRALEPLLSELEGAARGAAALARAHAGTPMAGRTLLQQALPTTFGLKAAGWLAALLDARARLVELRDARLAVQLGGAAGTLAALGDGGEAVVAAFADELDLAVPDLPWHTARGRVAELGAALAVAAGAAGKAALDIVLLAQTEVGEVAEAAPGGSSTLPHKRNPVAAIRARACAQRVPPLAALLLGAMAQEHERAAGAWHAEWEPLSEALALTGGALGALGESLTGLAVDRERMRVNLDATGGLLLAERVALTLGRETAAAAVERAADGTGFRAALLADPDVDAAAVDDLLDPAGYLGAAEHFIERALARLDRELA